MSQLPSARLWPANRPLKLHCDGSAAPNPGPIITCVHARGTAHFRHNHPAGCHQRAEWLALLDALELAVASGAEDVVLGSDSAMVVAMAQALRLGRGGLLTGRTARFAPYLLRFEALAAGLARLRLRHVRRHRNPAGQALDQYRAAALHRSIGEMPQEIAWPA